MYEASNTWQPHSNVLLSLEGCREKKFGPHSVWKTSKYIISSGFLKALVTLHCLKLCDLEQVTTSVVPHFPHWTVGRVMEPHIRMMWGLRIFAENVCGIFLNSHRFSVALQAKVGSSTSYLLNLGWPVTCFDQETATEAMLYNFQASRGICSFYTCPAFLKHCFH